MTAHNKHNKTNQNRERKKKLAHLKTSSVFDQFLLYCIAQDCIAVENEELEHRSQLLCILRDRHIHDDSYEINEYESDEWMLSASPHPLDFRASDRIRMHLPH